MLCGWLAVKHAKVKQKTGNSLDTWRLKMPPKHSYKVADQQAQLSSSKMNTNCKPKSNTSKVSPRKGFWFCAVLSLEHETNASIQVPSSDGYLSKVI